MVSDVNLHPYTEGLFMLTRSARGAWSIREITEVAVCGQQEPHVVGQCEFDPGLKAHHPVSNFDC